MALQKLWASYKRNLYRSKLQTRTSGNHLLFSAEATRRNTDTRNTCQASLKNSNERLFLTEKSVLCLASPTSQLKLPVNQTDGSDKLRYAQDSTLHASLNILSPLVSNLLADIGDCSDIFQPCVYCFTFKREPKPKDFQGSIYFLLVLQHTFFQDSWTIQLSTPCLENQFLTCGSSLQVEKISLTKPCFAVLHKHSFLLIRRREFALKGTLRRKETAILIV